MADVIRQGWLQKESPKKVMGVATWQRRYFVLSRVSPNTWPTLLYFKAPPPSGEQSGQVEVRGALVRRLGPTRMDIVETRGRQRTLKLQVLTPFPIPSRPIDTTLMTAVLLRYAV